MLDAEIFYWDVINRFKISLDDWKEKQLKIAKEYLIGLLEDRRNEIEGELESHELVKSKDKEDEIEEELKSIVEAEKSKKRERIHAHFAKLLEPGMLPEVKLDDEIDPNAPENLHDDDQPWKIDKI